LDVTQESDKERRARLDVERLAEHQAAVERLGYRLIIEAVPDIGPMTHAAFVAPVGGNEADRRFLVQGSSEADAAMFAREVLKGIVELDWPWPDPELAYKSPFRPM
jgi:hypothetical protein